MSAVLRLALAVCCTVAALRAAEDDLLLSPRQDAATWEKAWRTSVTLAGGSHTVNEILADLSTQSGVVIDSYVPAGLPRGNGSWQESAWSICQQVSLLASARRFLDRATIARLRRTLIDVRTLDGNYDLRTDSPVPLAVAVRMLSRYYIDASYRTNRIVVAPSAQLRPELAITRTVKLAHPWGCFEWDLVGGERTTKRTELLDAYSLLMTRMTPLDAGDDPVKDIIYRHRLPEGAAERLRAASVGVGVTFDPETSILEVTGHPYAVGEVLTNWVPRLDQPSPEAAQVLAEAFAFQRLRELKCEEARPLLDRLDAGEELSAEERATLRRIHAGLECGIVRDTAEAYFAAVAAADLDTVRRRFWDEARRKDEEQRATDFAEDLAAALAEPAAARYFDSAYGMKPRAELTYDQYLSEHLRISPKVEMVRCSGACAEVTYSADQPDPGRGRRHSGRALGLITLAFDAGEWRLHRGIVLTDPQPETWTPQGGVTLGGTPPARYPRALGY